MAPRRSEKKAFKLTRASALALAAVFVVSVGLSSLGLNATSRMSQLAVAKEADMVCVKTKDYSFPCGKQNPKTKKIGGKDCDCNDTTQGHTTQGKCQGPELCKATATAEGKAPDLPKLPEPKEDKKEPPPPQTAGCKEGVPGGFDEKGQPCPTTSSLLGAMTPTPGAGTPPVETPAKEETTASHAWAVIKSYAQDASNAVAGAVSTVSNAASDAAKSIGATVSEYVFNNNPSDVVTAGNQQISAPQGDSTDGQNLPLRAQTTGFTSGNTTVSGDLSGSAPASGGFLGWASAQFKNFFSRFSE